LLETNDRLRLALEEGGRTRLDVERLQRELAALGQELEATRTDREVVRAAAADRVTQLQNELDETRSESLRQFERTPWSMLRFNHDGALERVNHALAALLGYRTTEELRTVDFAFRVFESPNDLRWLINRCLGTGTTESVETTWRRKDGARLVVRLLALAGGSGTIEMVAEDVTTLRALEEKLRQAQRMEAVGRLASEVAVTCDNLLRDVSQDGHQWLATMDNDAASRHQGELLLDEVTRAASLLRQLDLYGKKQASALEPVDLYRVLRDLESVLRRVAGEDIEFVLPTTSSPMNVDVEPERVERILVNVAAYGRERMPFGGRLTIELTNVVVDREGVAEHSHFRPGPHVLITVTAVKYAVRWDASIALSA
ncbi:MAG: PAS domain S-box protein, partial [Vicinamibacterales bacterium]